MSTTITGAAPTATATNASTSNTALNSLSGNLTDFLKLLMTQLQNQDPSSPMDTSTFTTQLVQFASVEQQINTNSNLQTLIQSTQSNMILQSSSLVGKTIDVTSDHLALQNGQATVKFSDTTSEPLDVSVYNAAGVKVLQTTVTSQPGDNTWTWNGQDNAGNQLADGSYKIMVDQTNGTGLSTTVRGTVTGVQRSGSSVDVELGALSADVSAIQSLDTGS